MCYCVTNQWSKLEHIGAKNRVSDIVHYVHSAHDNIFYTGAFGKVYSGSLELEGTRTVVAIKTIKSENNKVTYSIKCCWR